MGALSILTYYLNNKRKVVPVTGIIALAVLVISLTGALTGSLFEDERRELAYYDRFAVVFSNQRSGLSDRMLSQLKNHPAVAETYEVVRRTTRTQGIFGSEGRPIYFLSETDRQAFADSLGWRLSEGRWPRTGTNEVVLTENILRNRGIEVGGRIGEVADERDWLDGEWLIVGTLASDAVTGGVGDRSYIREHFLTDPDLPLEVANRPHVLTIRPIEGKHLELEVFLDSLPKDQVDAFHRTAARRELAEELANIDVIIWILNGMSIVVLSLALGLLSVIFFMQRANEFGLLAALGYTKGFLSMRTVLEAVVTVAAGWALGILLSQGIYTVLNATLFEPKGLAPLTIMTPRVLLFTTPIPVTVTVFSVAVVLLQLWRMDPVAIIERRD